MGKEKPEYRKAVMKTNHRPTFQVYKSTKYEYQNKEGEIYLWPVVEINVYCFCIYS